jgi:hypothetical protein
MLRNNLTNWRNNIRPCLVGGFLIAFVFLTPNVGQQGHQSFFVAATASTWSRFGELAQAWCSLKIILFGIGALLVMVAPLRLANRVMADILATLLLAVAVMAMVLSMFGVYELVKAVL